MRHQIATVSAKTLTTKQLCESAHTQNARPICSRNRIGTGEKLSTDLNKNLKYFFLVIANEKEEEKEKMKKKRAFSVPIISTGLAFLSQGCEVY